MRSALRRPHARLELVAGAETGRLTASRRLDDRPPRGTRRLVQARLRRCHMMRRAGISVPAVHRRSLGRPRSPNLRARLVCAPAPVTRETCPVRPDGRASRDGGRRGRRHHRSRRGCRRGCGSAARARLRRRRVGRGRAARGRGGQQAERVDVAVRIGCDADPEVDVRAVDLGRPARADRPDRISLDEGRAFGDGDRAEVCQRDGIAVRRLDRDRLAARRKRTVPAAGATTVSPAAWAPMSMPRCWPDAYGCASS